jgi:hypothetical protein
MIYVARRRLKIGSEYREPGQKVPEAESWTRVEAWIHAGFIDQIEGSYNETPKSTPKPKAKKTES